MNTAREERYLAQAAPETQARVLRHEAVNAEYRHLTLAVPDVAAGAQAGQFFNLRCPTTADESPFLRRPMSTYRANSERGEVEFLYKIAGSGTRALTHLQVGDTLSILGPLGHGFSLQPTWRHIVVLGRGVGLATLAPLAEMAQAAQVKATVILSARTPELIMSEARFRAAGAEVITVTDEAGNSDVAHVEKLLRTLHQQQRADAFFTCGSERLMRLMQRLGAELNIPGQAALEQHMACGLGMCHGCVRPMRDPEVEASEQHVHHARRVCWDGPVFRLAEVV